MDFMEPQNVPCQVNAENQLEKRTLFKRLPGMNELSLINPWHAVRSLLKLDIPKEPPSPKPNSRLQRSIIDEMNPIGPEFIKGKFLRMGPMIKREENINPKYYYHNKQGDIMRFGKKST